MNRRVVVGIEANAEREVFRITGVTLKRDDGSVLTLTPNEAFWLHTEMRTVGLMEKVFLKHPKFENNLAALERFADDYREKLEFDHVDEIEVIEGDAMYEVFEDTSAYDKYRNEEEDEDDE